MLLGGLPGQSVNLRAFHQRCRVAPHGVCAVSGHFVTLKRMTLDWAVAGLSITYYPPLLSLFIGLYVALFRGNVTAAKTLATVSLQIPSKPDGPHPPNPPAQAA